jgi:transposase-like protein
VKKSDKKQAVSQEARSLALVASVAATVREGLHELVVRSGLGVVAAMFEADRDALCGPRYAHSEHGASRFGHALGELPMGGRRVEVKRPRVRSAGGRELPLPTWERLASLDPLGARAYEQMLVGVATRQYARSLEPVGDGVEERGTSKSAVSRRFVAATSARVAEQLARPLGELKLAAVMIDGIHFGEHVILVSLGIDESGTKHVLGLGEGATENAASCTALLANLVERGLDPMRSVLVVIDGGKALRKSVREVFGKRGLVQRCQVHKKRNVLDQLPERMRASVSAALSQAYASREKATALRLLNNLERRLAKEHPGAAASLREGLDETLTVVGLGLPRALERTLATTNPIENLNSVARRVCGRVKRWRGGEMILRWMTAAMGEATKGFRRLKGHAGLPVLIAWLRRNDEAIDGETKTNVRAA